MWQRIMGVVVTILIIVAALAAFERAFSPSFKSCIAKQDNQNGSNSSKEDPSGLFGSANRYIECTGDFIDKNNGSITALATIIIAAFTATLWRATTAQGVLAREAFIADKRAFVFAAGIQGLYEQDAATGLYNWRIGPVWQNSGDTPTRDLQLYTDGFLSNVQIPSTFDFNSIDPEFPPGPGMLGPKMISAGGQAPHFNRAPLTPQDLIDIQNNRKFFYLWGWAKYHDTLPNTPQHITRYCFRMICQGDPFTYDPTTNPSVKWFNMHEGRGNCADDGCELQNLS